MEYKVTEEVATIDFERLLDAKRITPKKREALEEAEPYLIEAVMLGNITINEDGKVKQILMFPVGEKEEINYKARLVGNDVRSAYNAKTNTEVDKQLALLSKMTDVPSMEMWGKLDISDLNISLALSQYFL